MAAPAGSSQRSRTGCGALWTRLWEGGCLKPLQMEMHKCQCWHFTVHAITLHYHSRSEEEKTQL